MKPLAVALIIVFAASALVSLQFAYPALANPEGEMPQLSMPIEHINYTITSRNGTMWALIDGEYPITVKEAADCIFSGELPMVYPMPPGTANIHVYLGSREIAWSNYTEAYPQAVHHTAIGDWWMIYAPLTDVPKSFVLKIHYEHPLQHVNSSYLFLYDLNINPYLSPQSDNSTAYFTIRFNINASSLQVYSAPPDSNPSEWKPFNYTATGVDSVKTYSIVMYSDYWKPLPGDLVVVFSEGAAVPEFPVLMIFVTSGVVLAISVLFLRKRAMRSSKTSK